VINIRTCLLRRLRDTDLAFINFMADIRDSAVTDVDCLPVGRVDQLFIDDQERRVRFVRVEPARGFDTAGGTVLIPVDAVRRILRGVVHVDRPREQLAIAPREISLLDDAEDVEMLYRYYGFSPFWAAGYTYPPYPFYA
jgi:hypothetical protein